MSVNLSLVKFLPHSSLNAEHTCTGMRTLPKLKLLKSTPISFLLLPHSYTHSGTPSQPHPHTNTRTRAYSHTRAVLSGVPPLDHGHLEKEVPAEARESQSETKGRRTGEGEERIGAQGPAKGRRDTALCEEQKERNRRREE